ncbi:hypothetical protein [Lentzea sp. NBRC 102530]|uniref:hypothetical protein n=1 Tax=Lentzea sp. NBRC 102530 TaxID=3032201 RepID=UPI0024A2228F|nr:hypothetical protein [Lentzea sp. NBRC 102530]GLY51815.1 hypothetical protein Lesp01_54710 [Lentzea sp. NBRC 102530]
MAVALTAVGCSAGPGSGSGDQQPAPDKKVLDVSGFGKLKPGMSKQDALATGELAASAAGRTGKCEDYRYAGAPQPDAAQLAEEAEFEKKYEAAQKAADDAEAALGPAPGANAGAAEFAAYAEKSAASAELSAKATELISESTKRMVARAEAREAGGGVLFAGDKIRMILPPPGVTTTKDIAKGATVEQLKAAYPNAVEKESGKTFEVPVPDRTDVVLSFHVADGKVTTFMLFNASAECV